MSSENIAQEPINNSVGILVFDAKGNIVKSNLSSMVLSSSAKGTTVGQDTEKEIIKLFMKLAEETSTFLENQSKDEIIDKIQFTFGDLEGVIWTDSKALWNVVVKRIDAPDNITSVTEANNIIPNRKSHEV